ncbi:MAG TPA: NADH-quinone oxidoreductase subunit J [Actinomycetes bacterium]|nr:NADH-quinone oxidoreductase subunit J [Actinomycetes bacterium]
MASAPTVLAAAQTGAGEAWLFWICAPLSVLAALGLVMAKKAVHSALMLALIMICLALFYIAQQAPFLGIVQVVVYTGAVMMLFLFVLMLVGVDSSDSLVETLRGQRVAGLLAAVAFALLLVGGIGRAVFADGTGLTQANAEGNVPAVAEMLFTRYVWGFEVTSALLITAALGTMVMAHRERLARRLTQRELAEARFRSGGLVTMLPAPGVYARHNAVDVPGLLPDGRPSELTINRVLAARGDVRDIHEFDTRPVTEAITDSSEDAQ